ncbi:MAG: LD-carboxypeptidase [Deltaproteobacteria bacterium]|jgi:muramoyltetrapeptide carboxypeptidase|nr:LD-carboxypeptidase [Deltaproteobacteria bacterium]
MAGKPSEIEPDRPPAFASSRPPAVKLGSTLGVFAPAGPVDGVRLRAGLDLLRAAGWRVKLGRHLRRRKHHLAGADAQRREDLLALLADPEVDALMAARGGYGCLRLVEEPIPWDQFPPKPLIGFSDLTVLLTDRCVRTGVGGWHAPMVMTLPGMRPAAQKEFAAGLAKDVTPPWRFSKKGRRQLGRAQGPLLGGNLSSLAALAAAGFLPKLDGVILLLEEHGDEIRRVDRSLQILRSGGRLEALAGLALGGFTDCAGARALPTLFRETVARLPADCPVALGAPFGHGLFNRLWPVGGRATLIVDEAGAQLTFLGGQTKITKQRVQNI